MRKKRVQTKAVMLVEYVEAAMARAHYELIEDSSPYYGEIPECRGVWATGRSLKECRSHLREVLQGWMLLRVRKGLALPLVRGRTVNPPQRVRVQV